MFFYTVIMMYIEAVIKEKIVLTLIFLLCVSVSFAQTSSSKANSRPKKDKIQSKKTVKGQKLTQSELWAEFKRLLKSGIIPLKRGLPVSKRDKELTSILPEDKQKYTSLLKQKKVKYLRLHDLSKCDFGTTLNVTDPCPWNIIGKATSFSFRGKGYRNSTYSDITLNRSFLRLTGISSLGFLVNLGEVELDSITLKSKGVRAMADFVPSTDVRVVTKQSKLVKSGLKLGQYVYNSKIPINENSTYAMRSIAYGGKAFITLGTRRINVFKFDKRTDIIVVFKIIKSHDDGSVSIIWKELKETLAPVLKSSL